MKKIDLILFFKRAQTRMALDPRLAGILELLSDVSGDKSLSFLAKTQNPEKIQKSHKELYELYSNPVLTNLLTFKLGHIPQRNKWCNTWIANGKSNLGMNITCPSCNKQTYLFVQIDTSDMCFLKPNKSAIFHIYTCDNTCRFIVISASFY
jgi:hypothetical protein